MDIDEDDHCTPFPPMPPQFMSVATPSSSLGDYEGDPGAMTTTQHLDEEKQPRLPDKSQETMEGGKPSKKPRHRHSLAQLAALNELFEKNEHPSLDERVELAEKLGMETKTVNAWFQNKRASTKKRNKGGPPETISSTSQGEILEDAIRTSVPSTLPSIASLLNDTPLTPMQSQPSQPRFGSSRRTKRRDVHPNDHLFSNSVTPNHQSDHPREGILQSAFFAGPPGSFSVQDRFVPQDGAVPSLLNADTDRFRAETDGRFVSENDGAADGHPSRKGRAESSRTRTSSKQNEELRRAYAINAHPTRDQRQELADRIGMQLKSVTNWFQNQRSQARKHKDEPRSVPTSSPVTDVSGNHDPQVLDNNNDDMATLRWQQLPISRPLHRFPDNGLSLHKQPPLPTLELNRSTLDPYSRMSLPPSTHPPSPQTHRSVTPYARDRSREHYSHKNAIADDVRTEDILARNRRTRPQPHQLRALKELLRRTSTPSIEERTALALEIGMDVARVTNWFRNVRQTARKRAKQARMGSSSRSRPHDRLEHDTSSTSSAYDDDDAMDVDFEDLIDHDMDEWSEEECQEAVTPSSGTSQSPPPAKRPRPHLPVHRGMGSMGVESMGVGLIEPGAFQELEKAVGMSTVGGAKEYALDPRMNAVTDTGVKIEDALLLLSFHQHVVH